MESETEEAPADAPSAQSEADPSASSLEGEAAAAALDGEAAAAALDGEAAEALGADASAAAADAAAPGPALGDAQAMLERGAEMLSIGGPVVGILLAMSIVALALTLAKLWQFAAARPGRRREVEAAVAAFRAGRVAEAQDLAARAPGLMGAPVAAAIEALAAGVAPDRARADAVRIASDQLEALRGWMRPLEVIGSLAPLLGLFGTVLGMIAAFAALEAAGSRVDPSILSGGIWEALLTTAVGLAVAIPTVAVVNWFERRVERCEHRLDSLLSAIFAADPAAAPRAVAAAAAAE